MPATLPTNGNSAPALPARASAQPRRSCPSVCSAARASDTIAIKTQTTAIDGRMVSASTSAGAAKPGDGCDGGQDDRAQIRRRTSGGLDSLGTGQRDLQVAGR